MEFIILIIISVLLLVWNIVLRLQNRKLKSHVEMVQENCQSSIMATMAVVGRFRFVLNFIDNEVENGPEIIAKIRQAMDEFENEEKEKEETK